MELVGRTALELTAVVRAGEVSATDVVRAHLDQLAEVEHRLGAFVTVRRRAALEEAAAIDASADRERLPLAGVPISVKDNLDVEGQPTRHGSTATSAELAAADDPVVANLKAAGAIVIGKTRCPEFSVWGTSEDADAVTVSPWDPTRTAGGSSGGAAAAVSAGVVPLSLATDGMGSIRIPAAACGVTGIKPGDGLAPLRTDGERSMFGMARYGPIATTVRDAALMLDVIAGTTQHSEVEPPAAGLKVAVSWRSPAPGVVVASGWREAAIEAGRLLNHAGHRVEHADPPYERTLAPAAIARWTQGVGAEVAALGLDPQQLQPRTRAHVAAGGRLARIRPVDEADAQRWQAKAGGFLLEHDVLITPTFARAQPAATDWHTRPWAANMAANVSSYPYCPAWNLADLPAAVVPLWHESGRPLSVQIVAGRGREDLVLSVAAQLEELVPWTRHAVGWGVPSGL